MSQLRADLLGQGAAADGANGAAGAPGAGDEGRRPEQSFDLDRPLREARDAFEKSYFEFHLAKEGGSMTRVAEKTGLERTHLPQQDQRGAGGSARFRRWAGWGELVTLLRAPVERASARP